MPLPTSVSRTLRIIPFLLVVAVAVWSLSAQKRESRNAPTDAEWAQAQQIVRDGWHVNDVIRVAPYWADSARAGMYEFEFNLANKTEEAELFHYGRLWVLADDEHADDALRTLPRGYELIEEWRPNDRAVVFLIDIPEPTHVLFDAASAFDSAIVELERGEDREICDTVHQGRRFCGGIDDWLYVAPSIEETEGSLHQCVYVGVQPEGTLRITWPDVTLGSRLSGNAGNTMPAVRAERGSEVQVKIEVDGTLVWDRAIGKWDRTFHEIDADTSTWAGSQHTLVVTVFAEDFFDRWICFRLRALQ